MTPRNLSGFRGVFRVMTTCSDTTVSPIVTFRHAVGALLDLTTHAGVGVGLAPLLVQLEEAAEPSGGQGSGAANLYKAPAALDVLTLLADIDRVTVTGLRMSGHIRRLPETRTQRVRLWSTFAGRWASTNRAYLLYANDCLMRWREHAQAILMPDPQIIETRAQPCPNCAQRTAMVWHPELRERVQRPSLYLDKSTLTVYCRCCGAFWGTALWGLLRRVLDSV